MQPAVTAAKEVPPGTAPHQPIIQLNQVVKTFQTPAGEFTALKGVKVEVPAGQFAAVIGKSGSGKSTLLNIISGIDRPTSGEVIVNGVPLQTLGEGQLAPWRGRTLGIVFQFFQLLPTLTLAENIMLPMDFCGLYSARARRERALALLDQVGLADHAAKLPAAVSGGQQQRVAIARALANDPPVLLADEPTGNLDSKMAESVFQLFKELARTGKTVVMVTHDNDLAQRAGRSIIIADGEIVHEYLAASLPALDLDQLALATAQLRPQTYGAGSYVIRQGDEPDYFYIITKGRAEVLLRHPGGQEIVVDHLETGQYFGEIALLRGVRRTASVRAPADAALEVLALDGGVFSSLLAESEPTRQQIDGIIRDRIANQARARHSGGSASANPN